MVAKDNRGKNGFKSNNSNVEIKVEDINDNTPYFVDPGNYTFSIPEDAEYGASVGNITALDKDSNPTLTYSIESGADGYFLIPKKTSGNMFTERIQSRVFGFSSSLQKPKVICLLTKLTNIGS